MQALLELDPTLLKLPSERNPSLYPPLVWAAVRDQWEVRGRLLPLPSP